MKLLYIFLRGCTEKTINILFLLFSSIYPQEVRFWCILMRKPFRSRMYVLRDKNNEPKFVLHWNSRGPPNLYFRRTFYWLWNRLWIIAANQKRISVITFILYYITVANVASHYVIVSMKHIPRLLARTKNKNWALLWWCKASLEFLSY